MEYFLPQDIAWLSEQYDRFANTIDPDAAGRDEAEAAFNERLTLAYDQLVADLKRAHIANGGRPELFVASINKRDFRRELIAKCKAYLKLNK
jgi:hypothetical protein